MQTQITESKEILAENVSFSLFSPLLSLTLPDEKRINRKIQNFLFFLDLKFPDRL